MIGYQTWTVETNGDDPKGIRSENGEVIARLTYINGDEDAVARLIAAAPDLLAALEAVLEAMLDETGDATDWMRYQQTQECARAAIARAKEETS